MSRIACPETEDTTAEDCGTAPTHAHREVGRVLGCAVTLRHPEVDDT